MPNAEINLRTGSLADSDLLADIWLAARAQMSYIPPNSLFEPNRVRDFFRNQLVKHALIRIARLGSEDVGFIALIGHHVDQLYCRPSHTRHGIGKIMLDWGKSQSPAKLDLWVLEPNTSAIRFYEREGFRTLQFTDGSDNMEQVPDRLMVWP